ncbi:MAG: helix-turn-helix transcriptional regulator [Saprospiraceae bacterium]
MNIGLKIKSLREAKNISREQMIDHLPMSKNTYKKKEYGEKTPTLDELKIIASVLKIDPILFLNDEGTFIVNHGDYYTGIGNVIINEKAVIDDLRKSLDRFMELVEMLTYRQKKKIDYLLLLRLF